MINQKTSYHLVDSVVAKDIFSDLGVLLISVGTRLQAHDITLLLEHRIPEVNIEDPISTEFTEQIRDLSVQDELIDRYLHTLRKAKELFQKIDHGVLPRFEQITDSYQSLTELHVKHGYFFLHLNKIHGHDEYTFRHSINVSIIASLIGKLVGLSQERCKLLGMMGLLHDIGKMKVPPHILLKPGRLTAEEYEEMKAHTIHGYELLRQIEGTDEMIQIGALYHHERLDGSGYPEGLSGDQIPIEVQILSVADIYDAICSDRVYKQKDSGYLAGIELMESVYNGKLNPRIVLPFVYYLIEGFIGGQATLSNGDQAEVMMIHIDEPHRPLLRMGKRYIDLRKERQLEIVNILAK